ncbi:sperm microtubule associated protein 2-like isoform X1 [Clavelina lepadiformis]|uniref:sperm microtubule associated protein 2-like isoform X1 n=1 Tax=Clavelina lepadiformis TaxID=159417 RepID=UPI0040432E18
MLEIQGSVSHETRIFPNIHGIRPSSRGYSRERMLELSKAKGTKQIWLTSFGPKLYWGDQDMMWPISDATLTARPTQRLIQLAVAKKNFQHGTNRENRPEFVYSCGRNSQIWEVSKKEMDAVTSDRVLELSQPKQPSPDYREHRQSHQYSCGRVSPIWKVKKRALSCPNRARTAQLARPKEPHPQYEPNSEAETLIKPIAKHAVTSERVLDLARPKTRNEGPFIDSRFPEDSVWRVTSQARTSSASPRTAELAKYKGFAEGYVSNRSVQWSVSRAARKAIATPRAEELAKPIVRASMDHVQFNQDAFLVSSVAMKAKCTPRLEELAQPIQR